LRVDGSGFPVKIKIAQGCDCDHTGQDLVMADNLSQPAALIVERGYAF